MRRLAVVAVLSVVACTRATPEAASPAPVAKTEAAVAPPGLAPEAVPPELAPLVGKADAAIADLQGTLGKRLLGRLAEAGPAGAVEVCAVEAQGLTAATGVRHGVVLGRTSTRLRNPRNAPRPWVKAWLDRQPASAAAAKAEVIDLGDRLGVIRPIAAAAQCLACHGTAIDPDTRALLGERYPTDAAVGFAEGDLRGAFWVEVPKVAAAPVADEDGGPSDD